MLETRLRPHKVYFELTNACNFRCDFCPVHESTRPRQHMDWTLYTRGIDEMAEAEIASTVGYHILGEPLLYPRIEEAVAYAHKRGLRTEINTNGSLLTPERVRGLMQAGLSQLSVSLQVVGEDAYACRGSSLPYATYYARLMEAARAAQEAGGNMDVVVCFMDTSTRRFFDIDKVMRIGHETDTVGHQLDAVIADLYVAIGQPQEAESICSGLRRINLREPTYVRLADRLYVYVQPLADWGNAFTDRAVCPAHVGTCGYALKNVGVLADGRITICCADYDGHTALGNLREQSFEQVLSSSAAQAIREGFERNRIVHPYCRRCIGSPSPLKAWLKGLVSIYLFKWRDFRPAQVRQVALLRPR